MGVADPADHALGVDDEGAGDAVLAGSAHPCRRHRAVAVVGDGVGHLGALLLDEGLEWFLAGALGAGHAHHHDVLVLLLELGEVGDARHARRAPGRPELDDVGGAFLQALDWLALDGLVHAQRRGLAACHEPTAARVAGRGAGAAFRLCHRWHTGKGEGDEGRDGSASGHGGSLLDLAGSYARTAIGKKANGRAGARPSRL